MTLTSDLRFVESANYHFIDWVKSLENNDRKQEILFGIGNQLMLKGVSSKNISRAYIQLAAHPFCKASQLSGDDIPSYNCSGAHTTDPRSDCQSEQAHETDVVKPKDYISAELEKFTENDFTNGQHLGKSRERSKGKFRDPLKDQRCGDLAAQSDRGDFVDNSRACHEENTCDIVEETRSKEGLPPLHPLEDSNIAKTTGKSDFNQSKTTPEPQNCQTDFTGEICPKKVCSAETMESTEKRKSVSEKPVDQRLQSINDTDISKVKNNLIVNEGDNQNKNSASVLHSEGDINLTSFQLEQQSNVSSCIRKSVDQELEEPITANMNINSSCDVQTLSEQSNKIIPNDSLLTISKDVATSKSKIIPINRTELVGMLNLKEQIEKDLSKKNVFLPTTSTNTSLTPIGDNVQQPDSKKSPVKSQKPSLSVKTNLLNQTSQKSKCSDASVSLESSVNAEETLPTVRENPKHIEAVSSPTAPPRIDTIRTSLESLKKINGELLNIKMLAQSRKRLADNSEDNALAAKMRRFSEQISSIEGLEKRMKEGENNMDHCNETNTQNPVGERTRDSAIEHPTDDNNVQQMPHKSTENNSVIVRNISENSNTSSYNTKDLNQHINNKQIPPQTSISNEGLSSSNVSTDEIQKLKVTDANVGNSIADNSSLVHHEEVNKTSSNVTLEDGKHPSGRQVENRQLSRHQLASQVNSESNNNSSANNRTFSSVNSGLENTGNKNETHSLELNQSVQNPPLKTNPTTVKTTQIPTETVQATTSIETTASPDRTMINTSAIYDEAVQQFITYFSSGSDVNFISIPPMVLNNINQYCYFQKRPSYKKLSEFLKLYMVFYANLFNNENFRKTIRKIAELLHLSVADYNRRNERREQATKLRSEVLRKEEINRANKDFNEILVFRGKQFANMFMTLLPTLNMVKGCQFLMMMTFYFKTTQALMKIDLENEAYVFSIRDVMKSLLMSGLPSCRIEDWQFFKIGHEEFKSNCCFVKQCLLTMYMSGYSDSETDQFWELVHCNPIIPSLVSIVTQIKDKNQSMGSSGVSNILGSQQEPITLKNLLKSTNAGALNPNTTEIQNNVRQQSNSPINNSTRCMNQSNIPGTPIQQKPQHQTTPNITAQHGAQVLPSNVVHQGCQQRVEQRSQTTQSTVIQQRSQYTPVQNTPVAENTLMQQRTQQKAPQGTTVPQRTLNQALQVTTVQNRTPQQAPQGTCVQQGTLHQAPQVTTVQNRTPQGTCVQQRTLHQALQVTTVQNRTPQQAPQGTCVQQRTPHQAPQVTTVQNRTPQQAPQGTCVQQRTLHQAPQVTTVQNRTPQQAPQGTCVQQRTLHQAPQVTIMLQKTPQLPPRPSYVVGVRVPSQQLPPFASLNQHQRLFQQWRPLSSSGSQANQGQLAPQAVRSGAAPTVPVRIAPRPMWEQGRVVNNIQIGLPTANQNISPTTSEDMSVVQECWREGCSEVATLVCSLCKEALYCTTDCQTEDWYNSHSSVCLK